MRTIHQIARRIAEATKHGGVLDDADAILAGLEGLSAGPDELLDGLVQRAGVRDRDEDLCEAYLMLVETALEAYRNAMEEVAEARQAIEDFQALAAERVRAGALSMEVVQDLGGVLFRVGIPVADGLRQAVADTLAPTGGEGGDAEAEFGNLLDEAVAASEGDVLEIVAAVGEATHILPNPVKAAMTATFARSPHEAAVFAAILFALDPEPSVRVAVAEALLHRAASLSPVGLRRLIATRNWRPEEERVRIDAIIRAARSAGVECASWDRAGELEIRMTALDGAGAQMAIVRRLGHGGGRSASLLFKSAVRDVTLQEDDEDEALAERVFDLEGDLSLVEVSRAYLDRIVRHNLALGLEAGKLPAVGLLPAAELLGGADWQPEKTDWRAELERLKAALPPRMLASDAVAGMARGSLATGAMGHLFDSWLEVGEGAERVIAGVAGRRRRVEAVLTEVLEARREAWAEVFLWTALWQEAAEEMPWQDFAIRAVALVTGHDMAGMAIMREIAERTVSALRPPPPARRPKSRGKSGRRR